MAHVADITQATQDSAQNAIISEMPQIVATVAAMKALSGSDNRLRYCIETETLYRYEATASAYVADDLYVLITGDGGDTRWIGVAGREDIGACRMVGPVSIVDLSTQSFFNMGRWARQKNLNVLWSEPKVLTLLLRFFGVSIAKGVSS